MPLRILIADSNPESRDLLRRLLCSCGFESLVASTGREFLEYVETFLPDVVLVSDDALSLEEKMFTNLWDRFEQGKVSVIVMPTVASHEFQLPELDGRLLRRLTAPWSSMELLNAILETTYIGRSEAKPRVDKANGVGSGAMAAQ